MLQLRRLKIDALRNKITEIRLITKLSINLGPKALFKRYYFV